MLCIQSKNMIDYDYVCYKEIREAVLAMLSFHYLKFSRCNMWVASVKLSKKYYNTYVDVYMIYHYVSWLEKASLLFSSVGSLNIKIMITDHVNTMNPFLISIDNRLHTANR